MTEFFWASDLKNCKRNNIYGYKILDAEIKLWLSKNLRKRSSDIKRRYDYICRQTCVWQKLSPKEKRKTYIIGVKIYSATDAMAFKLRWL